jgi:hypothetical protein
MTKEQYRILLAIFIGWVFIHAVFLTIGLQGSNYSGFWPFAKNFFGESRSIGEVYDFSEFLVYAGGPAVAYFIYKSLTKPK